MSMTTKTLLAASASLALAGASSAATIDAYAGVVAETDGSQTLALAGDASDMIVVIVSGEHGFNNTAGQANGVTYNGVAMSEVVDRDPVAGTVNTSYASIFVLQNPVVGDGSGVITDVINRGVVSAYAVSDVTGVAASGFTASGTASVTENTVAGNLFIAGLIVGGHNNNGNTNGITADSPLNLDGKGHAGNQWTGHAAASATVASTGSNSYSFQGYEDENSPGIADDNHFIVWVELQNIPEPGSMALLGLGGLLIGARRRRG